MYRRLLLMLAVGVAGATLGAGTASAQTETTFCNAALEVDGALASVEGGASKRAQIDRVEAALRSLEATAPPEIAADVGSFATTVRESLAEGDDPAADPAFDDDADAVDEYRYGSCGYQTADVTLLEYEFSGLPKTLAPGAIAFKITNTGTEVHELAVARLKSSESFRKTLARPEDEQGKKIRYVAQVLLPPDDTSYLFVDLTRPGRYGAACHIPVGTTSVEDLEDGEDHGGHGNGAEPHWREGMVSTFRVAAA